MCGGAGRYEHFILTRYSAVIDTSLPPPEEDWLRYRLGFFDQAAHASVVSQTCQEFRWLVYLDDRCSDEFRADIDYLAEGVFEPIWGHEPFFARVARDVAERCTTDHVITTWFDSDDALARDYVRRVHAEYDDQDLLYVNFSHGLQLDRTGAVYRYRQPSGSFISCIERATPKAAIGTVFATGHSSVVDRGPLLEVQGPPAWLMVVHGTNVANDVRGHRVRPGLLADYVDVDLDYRREVPRGRLLAEQARTAVRVWRNRFKDPDLLTSWARASRNRVLGTHIRNRRNRNR